MEMPIPVGKATLLALDNKLPRSTSFKGDVPLRASDAILDRGAQWIAEFL